MIECLVEPVRVDEVVSFAVLVSVAAEDEVVSIYELELSEWQVPPLWLPNLRIMGLTLALQMVDSSGDGDGLR